MGLGRMKTTSSFVSLFVKDLLKRERLTLSKIPGTENHCRSLNQGAGCDYSLTPVLDHWFEPAEQAVEEIKGNLRNLQPSGTCWKGLITCGRVLRTLALWAQENSTSMYPHKLRI